MTERDHWEARVKPLPTARREVPFSRSFTVEEVASLRSGLLPRDMDDRWIVLWHGTYLDIYRSWTGNCIFSIAIRETSGGAQAGPLLVNADPEQYRGRDPVEDIKKVGFILELATTRENRA